MSDTARTSRHAHARRNRGRGRPAATVLTSMDPTWLEPFLDGYAADWNPLKRLDFSSYHSYLAWDDDYQRPTLYKDDLRVVASDRATMRAWLKERRIATNIPTFVTETGIHPGPAFDESDPRSRRHQSRRPSPAAGR